MAHPDEHEHDRPEIDWIDANAVVQARAASPGASTTSTTVGSIGKRRGRWPAVVLSLVVVAVLFRLVAGGSGGRADEVADEPRPVAPSIAIVEADRTDRTPGTSAFERFPPFGFPELHAIVSGRNGEEPFRVSTMGSILAFDDTALTGRFDFSIDAGGEYLAAFSAPDHGDPDAGWVLWIGSVDGQLEPLATGVRSFAWHDSDRGRMAFVAVAPGQDEPRLLTIDLADAQPSLTEVPNVSADLAGRLTVWGEWGFVFEGDGSNVTAVDSAGELVIGEVNGSVIGYLPLLGLVMAPLDPPRRSMAMAVLPSATGEGRDHVDILVTPLEALAGLSLIPDLAVGGVDGMVAVQAVGDNSEETVVIVLDRMGAEVARLPAGNGRTPITWIDDGRRLAFIDEDRSDGVSLVLYDVADDDVRVLSLDFLDPLEHRAHDFTLG